MVYINTPTAERFAKAFRSVAPLADAHLAMLRFQHAAPRQTVTSPQMAHAAQFRHYGVANLQFGRLGRRIGDLLDFHPTRMPIDVLVTQSKPASEWLWTMRPQVAEALELLGWVAPAAFASPDEELGHAPLVEGAVSRVSVNAYERNPEARRRCIEAHGTQCTICRFSFGAAYGEVAEGYIHVHHMRPLSEIGGQYIVDPVEDLRPVCPNCHAVLHRRVPAYSIEEVQAFLGGRVVRAVIAFQRTAQ